MGHSSFVAPNWTTNGRALQDNRVEVFGLHYEYFAIYLRKKEEGTFKYAGTSRPRRFLNRPSRSAGAVNLQGSRALDRSRAK
jgi:hypothetical protein